MIKVGILSINTEAVTGGAEDSGGALVMDMVREIDGEVHHYAVIPHERARILTQIKNMAEQMELDLVFTIGGTGLMPHEVTPDATAEVIDRQIPGIVEAMRAASARTNPRALFSRAIAGVRKKSLVINLPSEPQEIKEALAQVLKLLPGAVADIKKEVSQHGLPQTQEIAGTSGKEAESSSEDK